MKSLSASIGAIVIVCLMLSACKKEEEATAKMEPQEEKAAVAQVQEEVPPPPKEEEPDLVPIGSLSESKAEEAPEAARQNQRNVSSSAVEQQTSGDYVIQVSIQSSKKAANAIVKKLADDGITAYIAEVENPGELEGTFYRVRIGYFPTIASAQEFGQQVLSSLNYAGWIDKRKNDHVGTPSGDNEACEEGDSSV